MHKLKRIRVAQDYSKNLTKRKVGREIKMKFHKFLISLHQTLLFLIRWILVNNLISSRNSEVKRKLLKSMTPQLTRSKAKPKMISVQCQVRWLKGIAITCLIVLRVKWNNQALKFRREGRSLKSCYSLQMNSLTKVQ